MLLNRGGPTGMGVYRMDKGLPLHSTAAGGTYRVKGACKEH